jgi:DNA-binding transcriptional regulator YhcF (GntR family)
MSRSEKTTDPRFAEQVTDAMKEAVLDKAVDGKVTCPVLRKLAEDQGVPYKVAGAAADLAGVRVGGCDLGCF